MTSLVFGNFYFDYYSYRFGLEFRLGFGFGLELGLGLRLVLWVRFFSLNYEMYVRTERAPSLFQNFNANKIDYPLKDSTKLDNNRNKTAR